MRPMTTPVAEMRLRADRLEASARGVPKSDTYAQALVSNALLAADDIRAAADQLEAVWALPVWHHSHAPLIEKGFVYLRDLHAALTANTTSKEGRNE